MKCFSHRDHEAVGVCKSCNKAVCGECAIDSGRGLACSSQCEKAIADENQIIDKSKQIYGIGKKPALMPTGLLVQFFFGFTFTGYGIYQKAIGATVPWLVFVIGVGFVVIGCIAWYKNRNLNLNC